MEKPAGFNYSAVSTTKPCCKLGEWLPALFLSDAAEVSKQLLPKKLR